MLILVLPPPPESRHGNSSLRSSASTWRDPLPHLPGPQPKQSDDHYQGHQRVLLLRLQLNHQSDDHYRGQQCVILLRGE